MLWFVLQDSLTAASDALVAEGTTIGQNFAATLPSNRAVTGSIFIAGAPDGNSANIRLSLYDPP